MAGEHLCDLWFEDLLATPNSLEFALDAPLPPCDTLQPTRVELLAKRAATGSEAMQIAKVAKTLIEPQEFALRTGKLARSGRTGPTCGHHFVKDGRFAVKGESMSFDSKDELRAPEQTMICQNRVTSVLPDTGQF